MMKFFKKFGAYLPILSAFFVTACVGISLRGYAAPIYEVEEPEVIWTGTETGKETEETEQKKGNFDLPDGIYKGSGTGFAGTISVSVEIQDNSIIAIHILSSSDDAAFFNRAQAVIDRIIEGQTLDVDVVSGATYSSRGIISAVKNALTGEQDTNQPAAAVSSGGQGTVSVSSVEETGSWKDGTYYGSGTGFAGKISVKVIIKNGAMDAITVESSSDGSSYMKKASGVISAMIASQSTNVDTVSGATYSSAGIIQAVRDALKGASISASGENETEESDMEESTEVQPVTGTIPYKDGIYYGTGEGYLGDITLAVVIQDQTIKAILVTETEDDEVFFNRAKAVIDTVLENQSTDIDAIDTVSGATYSSRGILDAIKEALKAADEATNGKLPEEEETDLPPESETGSEIPPESETDLPSESETDAEEETGSSMYIDGDYHETVICYPDEDEDFEPYHLSMIITILNDRITAITDIQGDGDESNDSYINRAANGTSKIQGVVSQITEKGFPEDIDTVSRATCSSNAIIEACRQALKDAERPMEEETNENVLDQIDQ